MARTKVIHQTITDPSCKHKWKVNHLMTIDLEEKGSIKKQLVFVEACPRCGSERQVIKV